MQTLAFHDCVVFFVSYVFSFECFLRQNTKFCLSIHSVPFPWFNHVKYLGISKQAVKAASTHATFNLINDAYLSLLSSSFDTHTNLDGHFC